MLYPGGNDEKSKEYMGLFLVYLSEREVSVTYTFYVLDDKYRIIESKSSQQLSYKKNQNWGNKQFCSKMAIRDEKKRALVDDTFIVACTIAVRNTTLDDECYDEAVQTTVHLEKLLETGDLSDITFEIGQEKMHLHKAIVTTVSPVFLAMFQRQMKEKEEGVVRITDVKYEVMKELFRYIYVREVNDIENIAADLLVAADKYDVKGLKLRCEDILAQNLNVDNALKHLELALKHNTTLLKSKAIEFVANLLEQFVDKSEFEQMDGMCKDELLRAIARNKVKNDT